MLEKSIGKTHNLIQPLEDTWGGKGDAGNWYINLDIDLQNKSIQEINTWYKESVSKTISAFDNLVRIWKICISPCNYKLLDKVFLKWELEESHEGYLEKAMATIENFPDTICTLEISIDLLVFVRSNESPDKPVYTWIRNFGGFSFCGGSIHGKPFIYLDMEHTLFCPSSFFKEKNNSELYSLNQPLLEDALKRWEDKFKAEIEPEGLPGIYKYGFLPED